MANNILPPPIPRAADTKLPKKEIRLIAKKPKKFSSVWWVKYVEKNKDSVSIPKPKKYRSHFLVRNFFYMY